MNTFSVLKVKKGKLFKGSFSLGREKETWQIGSTWNIIYMHQLASVRLNCGFARANESLTVKLPVCICSYSKQYKNVWNLHIQLRLRHLQSPIFKQEF